MKASKLRALWRFLKQPTHANWQAFYYPATPATIKLVVIGAQKGGTTALYNYLGQHPAVNPPLNKEVNYFNALADKTPNYQSYLSHFPVTHDPAAPNYSIDVSPNYMIDIGVVAPLINKVLPSAKIGVLLREPVSRAVSSWFMYKKYHTQDPDWFINATWVREASNTNTKIVRRSPAFGASFASDIQEELTVMASGDRIEYPIVEYGLYKAQLEALLGVFSRDQIIFLSNDELDQDTQSSLDKITDFIGITRHKLSPEQLEKHFVGDNKTPIEAHELAELAAYYTQQNKGLEDLIGRKLSWMD